MESTIGLIIQFTGVLLLTVLSLFLRRSLKNAAAAHWAAAWASLAFALFCLSLGFIYKDLNKFLFCFYFFGEYVFGIMLIMGCRALSDDYKFVPRSRFIFLPFILLAICLSFSAANFNLIFNLHALLMGALFAGGLYALGKRQLDGFGSRVMSLALALLAIDFFYYFAVFSFRKLNIPIPLPSGYLAISPIIDLILEVMLGFGMVIVLLEKVLDEVQKVNEALQKAHEKLERTAHTDPLTTALNRHAFYGFVKRNDVEETSVAGCVGFFDIDDLKPINDHLGHAVGDLAIRAVVSAIRKLIRAEDLIYRWGGDEFFVLLVSMNEEMARERMKNLDRMLTGINLEGLEQTLTVRVSYGFKDFSDTSELDEAIKAADEEMYRFKAKRKKERKSAPMITFLPSENIHVSASR